MPSSRSLSRVEPDDARTVGEQQERPFFACCYPKGYFRVATSEEEPKTQRGSCSLFVAACLWNAARAVFAVILGVILVLPVILAYYFEPVPYTNECLIDSDAHMLKLDANFRMNYTPHEQGYCRVQSRNYAFLISAAAVMVVTKLVSYESISALGDAMLGSSAQAKRFGCGAIIFRVSAIWSFYGVMTAVVSNVMKNRDQFTTGEFVAVQSSGKVFLVLSDLLNSEKSMEVLEHAHCTALDGMPELRSFSFLAFGYHQELAFLLGAILLALGELFKLDTTKQYIFSYFVSMEHFAFWAKSLVGDCLLNRLTSMLSMCQDFSEMNADNLADLQGEFEKLTEFSVWSLQGPGEVLADMALQNQIDKVSQFIAEEEDDEDDSDGVGSSTVWSTVLPLGKILLEKPELLYPENTDESPCDSLWSLAENPASWLKDIPADSIFSLDPTFFKRFESFEKLDNFLKTLQEYGLEFKDFEPVLAKMIGGIGLSGIPDLANIFEDGLKHLSDMREVFEPIVKKMLFHKYPSLSLPAISSKIESVSALLSDVSTFDDLQKKLSGGSSSIQELVELFRIPSKLVCLDNRLVQDVKCSSEAPECMRAKIRWEDMEEILGTADFEQLEAISECKAGPYEGLRSFIDDLQPSSTVRLKWACMRLGHAIREDVCRHDIKWEDAQEVLTCIDKVQQLEDGIKNPGKFINEMQSLDPKFDQAVTLRWGLASLRKDAEPNLGENWTWEQVKAILIRAGELDELGEAPNDILQKVRQTPEGEAERLQKILDQKRGAEETSGVNTEAQAKVFWSGLLSVAGASLWISITHIDVTPCVNFDSHVSTKVAAGFYTFHDDFSFEEFVFACHVVASTIIWVTLCFIVLAPRAGYVLTQQRLVLATAFFVIAWTVALGTYDQSAVTEESESDRRLVSLNQWQEIWPTAQRGGAQLFASLSSVPLSSLLAVALVVQGASTVVACKTTVPTDDEIDRYRAERTAMAAAKTETLACAASNSVIAKQSKRFHALARHVKADHVVGAPRKDGPERKAQLQKVKESQKVREEERVKEIKKAKIYLEKQIGGRHVDFEQNSIIMNAVGEALLQDIAEVLKRNKAIKLKITGKQAGKGGPFNHTFASDCHASDCKGPCLLNHVDGVNQKFIASNKIQFWKTCDAQVARARVHYVRNELVKSGIKSTRMKISALAGTGVKEVLFEVL